MLMESIVIVLWWWCYVHVWKTSQRILWSALEQFGKVQFCRLLVDKRGKSKGSVCDFLWHGIEEFSAGYSMQT